MWAHWGMEISQPGPAVSGVVLTTPRYQHLAVAAYLAHFKGQTRIHTESDLFSYLDWCQVRALDPLLATRPHIELKLRWLQEVRRYRPFTVSRRMSAVAGFYRTCVIDTVLEHSPAEYVRRPNVPPESPTLGLTHLQFEALLTAARLSANRHDLALVATLGLLGLRIFEACGASIADLGEEHGHRVLRVHGKGGKVVVVPLPPAVARAIDRAVDGRSAGTTAASSLVRTAMAVIVHDWSARVVFDSFVVRRVVLRFLGSLHPAAPLVVLCHDLRLWRWLRWENRVGRLNADGGTAAIVSTRSLPASPVRPHHVPELLN
jgi:integrase/recombinase XerD